MCQACNAILASAKSWAIVAEMEAIVIEEQVAAGLSVAGATRPLFPHEIESETRFADVAKILDRAEGDARDELESLQAIVGAAVLDAVFGDADQVTVDVLAAGIADLQAGQPDDVRKAIRSVADRMETILDGTYEDASATAADEAERQGVDDPPTLSAPGGTYVAAAVGIAAFPWQRVIGKVMAEHLDAAGSFADTITRDKVAKTIDAVGTDGAVDLARQAIHGAGGDGRADTADKMNPTAVWASELMDGETCEKCAAVDGTEYETVDEARDAYPHGGYRSCLGGYRCRGTLVFRY